MGLKGSEPRKAIKLRYRELLKQHYPVAGGDDSKAREIIEAYREISAHFASSDSSYKESVQEAEKDWKDMTEPSSDDELLEVIIEELEARRSDINVVVDLKEHCWPRVSYKIAPEQEVYLEHAYHSETHSKICIQNHTKLDHLSVAGKNLERLYAMIPRDALITCDQSSRYLPSWQLKEMQAKFMEKYLGCTFKQYVWYACGPGPSDAQATSGQIFQAAFMHSVSLLSRDGIYIREEFSAIEAVHMYDVLVSVNMHNNTLKCKVTVDSKTDLMSFAGEGEKWENNLSQLIDQMRITAKTIKERERQKALREQKKKADLVESLFGRSKLVKKITDGK